MTGLRLPLALGVAFFVAHCPALSVVAEPPPAVDIRSEDGKVLIAADQIRSYDWATHTPTLAPKVRDELVKRLSKDRIVSGIPFAIAVGSKDVYKGKFTTVVSSISFSTPIVVVDAQSLDPKLGADQLRIQLGCPTAEFYNGDRPRADRRIREALQAGGKLAEGESEHSKWLANGLREMQMIKPGMTREELLKVFQEQGGLSSRTTQRYAYRECPYIHADVAFEAVGAPEGKLTTSSKDRIVTISAPFLGWPILD